MAREWAKTHRDEFNALEAEFLAASRRKRLKLKLARAASILVLMASIIGGWEWFRWQKRIRSDQLTQAVGKDLKRAEELDDEARWPEAIQVVEGAQSRLEPGVGDELLRRRLASALESYKEKEEVRKTQERDGKFVRRSTTPAFWGPLTPRREGMIGRPSSPGISGHSASTGLTSIRCHPRERRS